MPMHVDPFPRSHAKVLDPADHDELYQNLFLSAVGVRIHLYSSFSVEFTLLHFKPSSGKLESIG